jgi:hypothetical protein
LLLAARAVRFAIFDTVIVAVTRDDLHFIEYATGKEFKTTSLAQTLSRPTMVFDDGLLYIAGSGATMCYTLRGDLVWQEAFHGKGIGDVALGSWCQPPLPIKIDSQSNRGSETEAAGLTQYEDQKRQKGPAFLAFFGTAFHRPRRFNFVATAWLKRISELGRV